MMPKPDTLKSRLQQLPPQWVAAVLGCVFSLWWIFKNPVLNADAYQYLRAAELFNSDGAHAVFARYGWFNYSILIALLNKVLPGGLLASAHVLNMLLQTLLLTTFIRLSQRLNGGRHTAWLAALVILAYPQLNEMRFTLVRDFGFLAFTLLSLELLLLVRDSGRWQHAALWTLAISLAAVFRLEALLLAAVAPLALLGNGNNRKVVLLYGSMFSLALVTTLVFALLQVDLLALMQFAYRYYLPLLFDLPSLLTQQSQALQQFLFTPDNFPGQHNTLHGLLILLFAYGYTVLANLVQALSVPVTVLLLHALWRGWLRPLDGWRGPLAVYGFCSLLILLAFVSIMHFLTERYALLLCLLLLLLVPGVLNRWIDHAQAQRSQRRYLLIGWFFVVYFFTDSLVSFGYSTAYLPQALAFLQTSTTQGSALVTNSRYLAYGSGRIKDYDQGSYDPGDALTRAKSGNTLAVRLKASEQEARTLLEQDQRLSLMQRFGNTRGDEVRIYQVH